MSRPSVEISGNLLSETILDSLAEESSRHSFAKPESFRWYKYDVIDSQSIHSSRIAEAYERLKARWDMLSPSFNELDISVLRDKWIKYLFSQLGYNLEYQKADIVADSGNNFCLSHRGWTGEFAPIVHTVLFSQDLDHKPDDGRHKYSPHDTLQRYLNQIKTDIWGIVTNGRELRILRDFHHESRQAYVKFDLDLIFEGRNYTDFRLLWRLIHPSRFIADEESKCILENLFEESKSAGVAIGESLQKNVRLAIESLANGFLLTTPELIDNMIDNNEESLHFYQQILRVIYRILFLFYAEQRKLMPTHSTLYARDYSLSSLRQKIESKEFVDQYHTDLWEGLKVTFQMVYQGVPELEISAFNGQLFDPHTIEQLNRSRCRNDKFLEAVQYMAVFEKEGLMHRISYIELSVDEIGAIYESLLEYIPRVSSKEEVFEDAILGIRRNRERCIPPRTFFLDPRGTSRKTSGSYYTHPGLVNALIESALVPVVEEKLKTAGPNKDAQEKALLSIKVCDPACGSAAFLIAATEYLGEQLAKIRVQGDYPSDADIRHARRDVLRHCIYGVDLNPMAVELSKVSLWLTAATSDQPLNFLDHRIKCGNSLIGTTPELIEKGVLPEAYSPVEGDNKELSRERIKMAKEYYKRKEREEGQLVMENMPVQYGFQKTETTDLSEMFDENSSEQIREIEETYKISREKEEFLKNKFIADYWCSAFFWKHNNETEDYPRPEGLEYLLGDKKLKVSESLKEKVNQTAKDYKFFHWHLEFTEVFANGGFDCVLGNPPWEKIKLQEREFFSSLASEIAEAPNASERKKLIADIKNTNPELNTKYLKALRETECQSKFIRSSEKFPLTGRGDINTYTIFTENFRDIINSSGRCGIVVPTGVATDYTTSIFFQSLVEAESLISLYDFINSKGIFANVHRSYKFCLLTLTGKDKPEKNAEFTFFLTEIEDLKNKERFFTLTKDEFYLMNPNTKTCPIFEKKKDAEIVKKVYRNSPVLINDEKNTNPWGIKYYTMFHMTNDSGLFRTKEELEKEGYELKGNIFINSEGKYLPLYEGKMIWIYNHRASSINYHNGLVAGRHDTIKASKEQLSNTCYVVMPRLWISEKEVVKRIDKKLSFLFGFRGIADSANERTAIFSIIPFAACGNSIPILSIKKLDIIRLLVANTSTFVFDYILRCKAGGNNINFYIVKQLPVIPPEKYTKDIEDYIFPRALELVYTADDLKSFAEDCGYNGEPFEWNEERRLELKTDLDALYAHLYQITKDELNYILDTFPIVKRKDMQKYSEYRTKRLIVQKYEELKPMFK